MKTGRPDNWQAVVAGVGGQGVLFVTRLMAMMAQDAGRQVLISEVHGMAQRGGSVLSHLKLGDFAGPLVALGRADLVLALDPGEAVRNLAYLAPGGALAVNATGPDFLSQKARQALAGHGARLLAADAAGLARAAGWPKGANLVLLAAAAGSGLLPFAPARMAAVVEASSPPQRRAANLELWRAGLGAAA
ncbi:MAG: 2-oxoacid:acceptor oxidoreductase family protein [Thermodesulfobacteriota bacterium]